MCISACLFVFSFQISTRDGYLHLLFSRCDSHIVYILFYICYIIYFMFYMCYIIYCFIIFYILYVTWFCICLYCYFVSISMNQQTLGVQIGVGTCAPQGPHGVGGQPWVTNPVFHLVSLLAFCCAHPMTSEDFSTLTRHFIALLLLQM